MAKKDKVGHKEYPKDLQSLLKQKGELEMLELHYIEKALTSNNPQAYIEAKTHIKNIEEKKKNNLRSFTYSPMLDYYTGQGYKHKPQGLSNELLRNMANTPQIKAIINTRIEQASNFNQFTTDLQKPGWTIQKKRGLFDTEEKELTNAEKREIEAIVMFLERGGNMGAWDFDGWETFTRKLYEDSWGIDQGVFEIAVDRMGRPSEFNVFDGTTFYLAEHHIKDEKDREKLEAYMINGYLPRYVQVFNNSVHREYYPWELCLGVRNASTSIKLNGYGLSENEVLIQVITWMLNSNNYNGNFFSKGSNPKGILNFKDNINPTKLEEFKQAWSNTLSGWRSSHKLAAISGGDLEWINFQISNRDMEFSKWSEFLTVLACTVFRIDPDEVGFHLESSKGMFGQDGQKERIRHSREKGLEPFMKFWQRKFTKFLIGPISNNKYEYAYTGLEPEDEEAQLKRDIEILTNGGMSVQDFFMKYSDRELDMNKDILLNQILLQYKQLAQVGDLESNAAVDEGVGGNAFDQFESNNQNKFEEFEDKSNPSDPFSKALNHYFNKFVRENHK